MPTIAHPRPQFDLPSASEKALRRSLVARAVKYVLDGADANPPIDVRLGLVADEEKGVTELIGDARTALESMFYSYTVAGTNDSTTAEHSAINLARARMRRVCSDPLDTRVPYDERTDSAKAFALAMKWFHQSIAFAKAMD